MSTIYRKIAANIGGSLKAFPAVFINGPRQAGKSTFVREILVNDYPAKYVSLDNTLTYVSASSSPESFLSDNATPLVIDEVQMVPELFRNIKLLVDEKRLADKKSSYGMYILTSSTNIMLLPKLADALVGRMSVKTLYPFAGCEVAKGKGDFIERLFSMDFTFTENIKNSMALLEVMQKATFPEVHLSDYDYTYLSKWFSSYLDTILKRDVRSVYDVEKIGVLPNLLSVLATRVGSLINDADIARSIKLNPVTSKNYRILLQGMFLSFDVKPWFRNLGKRLTKSPKVYLVDTVLLCFLLGMRLEQIKENRPELFSHVLENFVASELLKLLSFSNIKAKMNHFRTADNIEVDFILEHGTRVVGVEVKASSRVSEGDFKGLKVLQKLIKEDFIGGVVLYNGDQIVPFGKDLYAVPLCMLWN